MEVIVREERESAKVDEQRIRKRNRRYLQQEEASKSEKEVN